MKLTTAEIKILIKECIGDGELHNFESFRNYITKKTDKIFTDNQITGAIKQLSSKGSMIKVERGLYRGNNQKVEAKEKIIFHSLKLSPQEEKIAQARNRMKADIDKTAASLEEIMRTISIAEIDNQEYELFREVKELLIYMKCVSKKCEK